MSKRKFIYLVCFEISIFRNFVIVPSILCFLFLYPQLYLCPVLFIIYFYPISLSCIFILYLYPVSLSCIFILYLNPEYLSCIFILYFYVVYLSLSCTFILCSVLCILCLVTCILYIYPVYLSCIFILYLYPVYFVLYQIILYFVFSNLILFEPLFYCIIVQCTVQ